MSTETDADSRELIGRWTSIGIVVVAAVLGLVVLHRTAHHPRTDDAAVLANYIGMAPQVEGLWSELAVHDNQFVKKGELLFEIDDRPYQYALETAMSEQASLEGQIADEQRKIAALQSAVSVAEANIHSAEADVAAAEQGVERAEAEWAYASNNLQRLEPLLANHFVTVDDIDKAKTSEIAHQEALGEAQSHLLLAQSELTSARAQHEQAGHAVPTLEPLTSQRGAKEAAVKRARYDLDNCRVYAPFDARVTNLTISEGAYAHVGQQMFILIDARQWWAVANFREGQLKHIRPGMKADVYVMSKPDQRFAGHVDSIGFGVMPDADVIGSFAAACRMSSEPSIGFIWLRDIRCAYASRIPTRNCFVSANPPWSSSAAIEYGFSRRTRGGMAPAFGLVAGVSQGGTRAVSGKRHVGRTDGHRGDAGHAHHHDFSSSVWRPSDLRTCHFARHPLGDGQGRKDGHPDPCRGGWLRRHRNDVLSG